MVGELRALLDTVELGTDVLPRLVDALREALHAERSIAYGVEVGPERFQASFTHISGFSLSTAEAHAALNDFLGSMRDPYGYFNPACPQPSQRNRVLQFQAPGTDAAPVPLQDERLASWKKLGITAEEQERFHERVRSCLGSFLQRFGLERQVYLRVLVCDGPALLGWVGGVRAEPFTERELRLLEEITPALQRRLLLDTRLREAGILGAALQTTLEAIGQPAYVVTSTGRIAHANSAGQVRLNQDGESVRESLCGPLREEPAGENLSFTPLRLTGVPLHYLAIERNRSAQVTAHAHSLRASWGLTKRETEVLGRLVYGDSNKAISLRLDCAERTVEVHVTRILAKAQVESRSALIAKFFLSLL
jgi:DNA-binding CsgD family transcriptional regulator